jgi:hypothetical protein
MPLCSNALSEAMFEGITIPGCMSGTSGGNPGIATDGVLCNVIEGD